MANKDRALLKEAFRDAYPRVPVENPRFIKTRKDKDGNTVTKGQYTLGVGMHGKVIKAYSRENDCYVAIKSERRTGRTSAEELIHRSLKSPNVVQLLEVRDIGSKHYIVMELGERTLKDVVQKPALLNYKDVEVMTRDLLHGLRDLHKEGVYHRDVKLGNLVAVDGHVKIIDFGKSVRHPGGVMQRTYERADAWAACRVIAELDTCMRFPYANSYRHKWYMDHHPLLQWARSAPHITIDKVMGHPLLKGVFPEVSADEKDSTTSRVLSRAAQPFRRSFEFITSKMPLVRSLDLEDGDPP
jgi:serine/threonine protein kinase